MANYIFGLFGSFAAHEVFRSPAAKALNLRLGFQFRSNKNFMLSPVDTVSFSDYAKKVQFLCIDFLEDRLDFDESWKKKCLDFIQTLKTQFRAEQVFLFEFYLTERFEDARNPFWNSDLYEIRQINYILRNKYNFMKKNYHSINTVKLNPVLSYTDKYHENGCLPQHYNKEAYQYVAKAIYAKIKTISDIPEITVTAQSETSGDNFPHVSQKDDHYRIDAYKNSCKYRTLRDWMYKKSISRAIDRYLKDNGYTKIAIYGMAEIGQLFLWEMQSSGIEVAYSIDGNADMLFAEVPILKQDAELPEVDALVVCVPFAFEEIKYAMMQKMSAPIISIEELIYEA